MSSRKRTKDPLATSFAIVIAPIDLSLRIEQEQNDNLRLLRFTTLEEFDRWRNGLLNRHDNIAHEVHRALRDMGFNRISDVRSPAVESALHALATAAAAPQLPGLVALWTSRRSFYRDWSLAIPESPAQFLMRVRLLHAERLRHKGLRQADAARAAGFTSAQQLRRAQIRRASQSADRGGVIEIDAESLISIVGLPA